MAKVLDSEMAGYFTQLNDAEKKSVIQMIKTFLKSRTEQSESVDIRQYNSELREAEIQYGKGDYLTHEDFVKQLKKW